MLLEQVRLATLKTSFVVMFRFCLHLCVTLREKKNKKKKFKNGEHQRYSWERKRRKKKNASITDALKHAFFVSSNELPISVT